MDEKDLTIRVVGEVYAGHPDNTSLASFTIWSRAEQYAMSILTDYPRVRVYSIAEDGQQIVIERPVIYRSTRGLTN